MITGAIIMAVGVLLGATIRGMAEKNSDGPRMTVVKNHTAPSGD